MFNDQNRKIVNKCIYIFINKERTRCGIFYLSKIPELQCSPGCLACYSIVPYLKKSIYKFASVWNA
jgi:hypothetical protein